jgi:hypothetical protein
MPLGFHTGTGVGSVEHSSFAPNVKRKGLVHLFREPTDLTTQSAPFVAPVAGVMGVLYIL